MYKTRGKPEDPWNKAASEQEKGLAEAIHVNQIRRNGMAQQLQKFSWSPTVRQKELQRRRNNYEEFREIYRERLRKSTSLSKSLKNLSSTNETDSSYDRHNIIKRFVSGRLNDICNNDDTQGCHKPAMLRAPTRTVKTIKVDIPVRYKEAAIFCPPKSEEGESLPFLQKFKEIEKLEEKLSGNMKMTIEESVQTDLVKELQEANIEVDVGNAQLEQINKILKATRVLGPLKEEEESEKEDDKTQDNNPTKLYNVRTPQKQVKAQKPSEKKETLSKKNKLLLTLNDVSQRIQRMQAKFFNDNRPRYKSIRGYRPNKQPQVEVLYKNDNYPHNHQQPKLNENPVVHTQTQLESKKYQNQNSNTREFIDYGQSPNRTPNTKQKIPTSLDNNSRASPRFVEIPYLNISGSRMDSFAEEFLEQSTSVGRHVEQNNDNTFCQGFQDSSPSRVIDQDKGTVFIDNGEIKTQELQNFNETSGHADEDDDEDITIESVFKPKLQESIFKSDFLMKEFDIHPKDMHFDTSKRSLLQNKTSNNRNVHFSKTPLQKLRDERIVRDYSKARNKGLYNPSAHYILKNTLYSTDEK